MGERIQVKLEVLATQEKTAIALMTFEPDSVDEYNDLVAFTFNEVNYGNLGFLPLFKEKGIAYTTYFEAASDWSAGSEHMRFTEEGEAISIEIEDIKINPDINELMKRIDDYAKLKKYIEVHLEMTTPLPWENQEEYGKRYRARQLISK